MLPGLYSAATAMEAATVNQDVVAHNLAHVNVPGFRRSVAVFKEFQQVLDGQLGEASTWGTTVDQVRTDFRPGGLQTTGRQLDLALSGDGFFVLDGPSGPLYTRCGVFFQDAQGRLVNAEGLRVRGTSGTITVPPGTAESQIKITSDGSVSANAQTVGQLSLVRFADLAQLTTAGTTSFRAASGAATQPFEGAVMQGGREASNVAPIEELVRMISGQRYFEASQRALRTIAETVGQNTGTGG